MTHYRITRKSILRSSWRERVHSGNTTVPRIKNFDKSKYLKTLESSLKTLDIKWSSTKTKEELDVVEGIRREHNSNLHYFYLHSRSKVPYKLLSKNKLDFWCEELSIRQQTKGVQ